MEQKSLNIIPRIVIAITREEDEKKLAEVLDSMNVSISFQLRGKGTAPSEMMDIFGLSGTTRVITFAILAKFQAVPLFEVMRRQLFFHQKGGGIAITVPIIGLQSHVLQMLNEEARADVEETMKGDEKEMREKSEYTLICVSVGNGYSDDVIDAARDAGAKGGTIIKGRRRGSERANQLFGISIQEEQEFIMIVVPREKKNEIMSAITKVCGLGTDAHGIVISVPVDDVMGLAD